MLGELLLNQDVIVGLSLVVVLVLVLVLVRLARQNCYDIYLDMVSENRILLIVNERGRIDGFTVEFANLFSEVQNRMKLVDFIEKYRCFSNYEKGKEFTVLIKGERYTVKSTTFMKLEVIELENMSVYLEKGATSIRELFLDFEKAPMSFLVDLDGNVLSASVSFGKYWRLFDGEILNHISDIGIYDRSFVFDVMNNDYHNGSLTVNIDGLDIFEVHANKVDEHSMVVHLTLIGEGTYFSSGQYDVLGALINAIDDGLVAISNDGKVTYANMKMHEFIGRDNLVGENILSFFRLYDKDDRLVTLKLPLEPKIYEYAWFESPFSDTRLVVELVISEVLEHDGFRVGYVLNFRDTSLRQSIAMKSYRFAYRDALTGAYNRHYLKEYVSKMQDNVENFGIVMLDCNGLKVINDSFGHDLGDKVIQTTARVLINNKRAVDSVIRMGGDEFAVLLPDCTYDTLDRFVRNVRRDIADTLVEGLPLSVSVGGEYHETGQFEFSKLLAHAEIKMYHNKMMTGKEARDNIMRYILDQVIERNPWEKEHSDFVSFLGKQIALEMNLGDDLTEMIEKASKYHVIGKIGLSKEALLAGSDDPQYKEQYETHTELAFRILSSMPEYSYLANTVLLYKENYDGTGLPQGLKEEEIPLSARILRVASSASKLMNPLDKSFKKSVDEAMVIMKGNASKLYDPNVVSYLLKVVEKHKLKEIIR